jgi:hypothetical protein
MPQPLAHLYELALRALDEQERRASELRGRVGPVLAAGGVGTTLLAGPAFSAHSRGPVQLVATAIAVGALLGAVGAAGYLLWTQVMDRDFDVQASVRELALLDALDDPRRLLLEDDSDAAQPRSPESLGDRSPANCIHSDTVRNPRRAV